MQATTSLSLLEKLKSIDDDQRDPAWSRFVYLYTPLLMHWASKQGFRENEAEDLIQEAFLRLMTGLKNYQKRSGSSFRGWLMTMLRNLGNDYRRRRATRNLTSELSPETPPTQNPWIEMEEVEFRNWILQRGLKMIRDDFSEETWKAFEGLVLHGRSAQSIAQELETSANSVYLARHRVLARLREELAEFVD